MEKQMKEKTVPDYMPWVGRERIAEAKENQENSVINKIMKGRMTPPTASIIEKINKRRKSDGILRKLRGAKAGHSQEEKNI